ncbi:MAG: hypothetical protein KME28_09805 [Pelatocladus maniniholoensis HA4357-MV3]|jgi:hypothetical protein|uniref:Uncharacterized protein n=1 Tax=Pelatocladus maniniholoensis HA4357-MV3 TaxID=1117104 RepID=A0A9E3H751_9NOST|nr:hypothetical protein [Pelatocladus maniniholoensis HA4357-MV3]BAZ70590.1 hypothetical protein NIES4106_53850 [Fischerella sp. NIES-4106]
MSNSDLCDIDIEVLLFGKWRFDTSKEKISVEFKTDMTYEQIRVQTFISSKPKELLTGNKFNGVWYINDRVLYLNLKSIPKSPFNLQIPLFFKVSFGDILATFGSLFITEKYEVIQINNSKFVIKDGEESIIGTKIINHRAVNL